MEAPVKEKPAVVKEVKAPAAPKAKKIIGARKVVEEPEKAAPKAAKVNIQYPYQTNLTVCVYSFYS